MKTPTQSDPLVVARALRHIAELRLSEEGIIETVILDGAMWIEKLSKNVKQLEKRCKTLTRNQSGKMTVKAARS